jgi:hypothetical protein
LGWISIAVAVVLFVGGIGLPTVMVSRARSAAPGGGGIGAVTGGITGWAMLVLVTLFVCGVGAAIAGVVRGERPLWVHCAGGLLTLAAPVLAIAAIRAWIG